jgi:hypothetical protein
LEDFKGLQTSQRVAVRHSAIPAGSFFEQKQVIIIRKILRFVSSGTDFFYNFRKTIFLLSPVQTLLQCYFTGETGDTDGADCVGGADDSMRSTSSIV